MPGRFHYGTAVPGTPQGPWRPPVKGTRVGMQILWQDIFPEVHPSRPEIHLVWDALSKMAAKVCRADTQVTISHVDKCCYTSRFPCLELLNKPQLLDRVVRAENDGYDAVLIGCYLDPCVQEARGCVRIPVAAPGESSMLLAQLLGTRFATVAVAEEAIPLIERNIRAYGFEDRAIRVRPVRHFDYWDLMIDSLRTNRPDDLIAAFEEVARGCVRDGADIIIAGCAYLGPVFTLFDYHEVRDTGVPVIDPGLASLKLAELSVDLRRVAGLTTTTSRNSLYHLAPRNVLDQALHAFGYGKGKP